MQRELEEERRAAAEEAARAQEAIQAKLAELQAIEAARRKEVGDTPWPCVETLHGPQDTKPSLLGFEAVRCINVEPLLRSSCMIGRVGNQKPQLVS